MPDDPKPDDPNPEWIHDQHLSFSNTRNILPAFKKSVEEALDKHRRELAKHIGVRDSMRR